MSGEYFYHGLVKIYANSILTDKTPSSALSDLGLNCLSMSYYETLDTSGFIPRKVIDKPGIMYDYLWFLVKPRIVIYKRGI